jgi:topoisomerase-4 subunit A
VNVTLKPHSKLKKLQFDEDFASIAIKGRNSIGNIITKYPVKKILLKTKGVSTLSGRKIWYDAILKRLNADGRGKYLGEFDGDDRILTVLSNGIYELTSFDLNNHFDDKMIVIEKYDAAKVFSVVHIDGKSKNYMVKRFVFDNVAIGKQTSIISDENGSKLVFISGSTQPIVKVEQLKGKEQTPEAIEVDLSALIDVKGMKAMGNRLSQQTIKSVELLAEVVNEEEAASEPGAELEEADEPDTTDEVVVDKTPEVPAKQPEIKEKVKPAAPALKPVAKPVEVKTEPVKLVEKTVEPPEPEKPVQSFPTESVQSSEKSVEPLAKPTKKVDFEITNPDDIDIDEKGQLGLF